MEQVLLRLGDTVSAGEPSTHRERGVMKYLVKIDINRGFAMHIPDAAVRIGFWWGAYVTRYGVKVQPPITISERRRCTS